MTCQGIVICVRVPLGKILPLLPAAAREEVERLLFEEPRTDSREAAMSIIATHVPQLAEGELVVINSRGEETGLEGCDPSQVYVILGPQDVFDFQETDLGRWLAKLSIRPVLTAYTFSC